MPESAGPIPVTPRPAPVPERLDSWKEIASYLGREIRTVQLWEKNEGLPIHRHQHARQGSVYAFKTELDTWRLARKNVPDPAPPESAPPRRPILLIAGGLLILAAAGVLLWKTFQPSSTGPVLSSVVVLPFIDLSAQKDQDYFSDGLTEEIIDALSRVPNLRVVARTSAFAFKGKNADIRQIGQQLNVNAVLEGSVRKDGENLRITAQLNRVTDGTHLWSRTFDRQLRDIFTVQREISQSIADLLRAGQVPHRQPTSDMEAYRLYQEGRYFFNQHLPPDSYNKAIERYQQAIQRDPKFALAYSGMADAYSYMAGVFVVAPKLVNPKSKEAAEKAVALDDSLAEAHASLGIVKLEHEWDPAGARTEFDRALQLSPGSSWVHHWIAHTLEAQNREEEAMKEMRMALDLDPLSLVVHWDVAHELIRVHRYGDALRHLEKSKELFPNQPILEYFQAEAYHGNGDAEAAHRVIESMKGPAAPPPAIDAIARGLDAAWNGRRAKAQSSLAELERLRDTEYVEPVLVMELCHAVGDHACLLKWFNRAHDEQSCLFVYLPFMRDFYAGDADIEARIPKYR